MQNRFSDSFGFKNPILDFLKETYPYTTLQFLAEKCYHEFGGKFWLWYMGWLMFLFERRQADDSLKMTVKKKRF